MSEVEVEPAANGHLQLRFVQSYRSATYADKVRKRLELARAADGAWRIVREVVLQ